MMTPLERHRQRQQDEYLNGLVDDTTAALIALGVNPAKARASALHAWQHIRAPHTHGNCTCRQQPRQAKTARPPRR